MAWLNRAEVCGYDVFEFRNPEVIEHENPTVSKFLTIAAGRNKARAAALETFPDAERFLLIDSDVVPPADAIERLLESKYAVTGGWYPIKGQIVIRFEDKPEEPPLRLTRWVAGLMGEKGAVQNYYKPRTYKFAESHIAPLGCLMIARELFEAFPFRAGVGQTVHCARFGFKMLLGDCTAYGLDIFGNRKIPVMMHPQVICDHV